MKRLITILGLLAAVALSVGAATVVAHHGGDQGQQPAGTTACTTPGAGGNNGDNGDSNDKLVGGSGRDILSGGRGRDRINSRDGKTDRVSCGRGNDTVKADRKDKVAHNCEHVKRS